MKALILQSAQGPDAPFFGEVERPEPQSGQVRVAIRAASLNHRELWITLGRYPNMSLPCTMGCDGAGMVESVGPDVDTALVGQDVMLYPGQNWGDDPEFPSAEFGLLGMPGPGTIAEEIVVPVDAVVPKPAHLDFAQAAAVPLGALTAWRGLFTKGRLKAGEKLLITGIGGGVATFALKFAVALGAEVFVTSGSDETIAKAVKLGAKGGLNYKDETWSKALPALTGGLNLVFDGAPASSYPGYGRALKMGARVVIYGPTGGSFFQVSAPELMFKNIQMSGTNVGNPAEFREAMAFVASHQLFPEIDRSFPLTQAKEALKYLETSHQFGKVVLTAG